jgi:hypothetical protein
MEGFRSIEKASSLSVARLKEKQIKQCVQSSVQSVDQKENILKASIFFLCLLSTET